MTNDERGPTVPQQSAGQQADHDGGDPDVEAAVDVEPGAEAAVPAVGDEPTTIQPTVRPMRNGAAVPSTPATPRDSSWLRRPIAANVMTIATSSTYPATAPSRRRRDALGRLVVRRG